ncbi:MAG: hypothetical protein KDB05_31965, partial [Planctomycetales bacterium]|nr:hypothetical protein [Planctomycetales bacterium]
TQADINANTTFSISMVNNGGASPTLLVANSVLVDGSGVLNIEGSSCGDVIVVRDDPNSGGRNDSDAKSIFVGSYTGRLTDINDANNLAGKFPGVTYNAAIMNASFGPVVIAEIRITAGDGNDIVRIGDGGGLYKGVTQNSTIDGGNGDDVLRAGAGRSTIYGRDGSDFIVGGSDNDVIYGGNGDDYIDGQAGLDRIFGDDGNDWLSGGDGDDPLIRGGAGNDTLSGGPGKDRLLGDSGMDTAYQEKNGTTSVDIFVSATNVIPVATAALPDPCQDKLNKLVDRFWTNDQNSSDGLDTLDEIISTLLP